MHLGFIITIVIIIVLLFGGGWGGGVLAALRPRREAGAALRALGQLRFPGALPYRVRLPVPLIPEPAQPLLALSRRAGRSRGVPGQPRSHRPAVPGPRSLSLRAGRCWHGHLPRRDERFLEPCERPADPGSALPHTGGASSRRRWRIYSCCPPGLAGSKETERDDVPWAKGRR